MKRAFSAPLALLLAACMLLPVTAMAADTGGQTADSGEAAVGLSGDSGSQANADPQQNTELVPWESNLSFYLANGLYVQPEQSEDDIKGAIDDFISRYLCFHLGDELDEIFLDIELDELDIIAGKAGQYYATGSAALPDEYTEYTLPEGLDPLTIPIRIRDSGKLEIFLDSLGSFFSGSIYLPANAEAEQGYVDAWYAYCGEEMPTAEQLDALTDFKQDNPDECPFFFGEIGSEGALMIDFGCLPEDAPQGWYAFYVEAGGLTSNYILIDSRVPTAGPGYLDGTRDGGDNSDFPPVEQGAPAAGDKEEDGGEDNGEEDGESGGSGVSGENARDDAPVEDSSTGSDDAPDEEDHEDSSDPDDQDGSSPDPEDDNGSFGSDDNGGSSSSDYDNSGNAESSQPDVVPADAPVQPIEPPTPAQPEPAAEHPAEPESKPFAERDTETGVTLSGVRVAALIEAGQPLVVTKGGVTAHISAEALAGLGLGDEDFLSVSITQPKENEVRLMVEVGGVPAEPPREMLLSLQNIPYDPAQSYTVTHESGEVIPCHEEGGRLAFTARMLGSYVVASEPKLTAEPMLEQPTQEIQQAAAQTQEPSIFPWAAALVCIAVLLPALFLWHRRRGAR